jgi:hypothetical protein
MSKTSSRVARFTARAASFVVATAGAAAVLGVGAATAEAAADASPFAGSWSGTYSVADPADPDFHRAGSLQWTISDEGRLTGTFQRIAPAFEGTFTGHVGADGKLMMIVHNESGGVPHAGTAAIGGDGSLVATATDTFSPRSHTWTVVATRESD